MNVKKGIIFYIITLILIILSIFNYFSLKNRENVNLIKTKDAYDNYYVNNKAIFIDTRAEEFFDKMHIKNSVWFFYLYRSEWESRLSDINKNKTLIIYCDSKSCNLSSLVAVYLRNKGFKNIFVLSSGIKGWIEKKYPVE